MSETFAFRPIGFVRSPFSDTRDIPKGLGAKHPEEGVLEVLPELEPGLLDIEGFSHLFVLWVFDRPREHKDKMEAEAQRGPEFQSREWNGYEYSLMASPPNDIHSHGVFATR